MRCTTIALLTFAMACTPDDGDPHHPGNNGLIEPALVCDAVVKTIPANKISALGFSPAMALDNLLGTISTEAMDEANVTVTGIEISIEQLDGPVTLVEFVDPETGEPVTSGFEGDCERFISVPVEAMVITDNDAFAFAQDLDLQITGVNEAQFDMALDVTQNEGTHVADMAGIDSAEYRIQVELSIEGADGELSLLTEGSDGSGPDSAIWAELQTLLTWTAAL